MANKKEKLALNALVNICENEQEREYASISKFFDDLFIVFERNEQIDLPEYVETCYTGIHLNETYEESDFLKMIEQFRNNKILHIKYALQILNDALVKHKQFSNISNCNLMYSSLPSVIIVGDLHGSFKDLYYIIEKFGIPGKEHGFVFNGDFVDRGPQQCEVLLTLLFAFLLYPNRVFLNRGNHEDLSLNLSNQFSPNFKSDCVKNFNQYGNHFFQQAEEFFRYLPIATVVTNKVGYKCFVIHGGISERIDLSFVAGDSLKRYEFASITIKENDPLDKRKQAEQFSDLLWSDPITKNTKPHFSKDGCFPNTKRGVGYFFGEDISENFCKKNNFNTIIRSHEVRPDGYSRDHPFCWTIFSSSDYCNGSNSAAVLILNQKSEYLKIHVFKTKDLDNDSYLAQKDFLLTTFKIYLEKNSEYLIKKFEIIDTNKTGKLN
jgi:serine/threonine-protein phosphatase with EF-hands